MHYLEFYLWPVDTLPPPSRPDMVHCMSRSHDDTCCLHIYHIPPSIPVQNCPQDTLIPKTNNAK